MVLRVQRLMGDAPLVQKAREPLGALDGNGADQAGLALAVALGDVIRHRVELRIHRAVDQIVHVLALHGPVGRDSEDGQLVDLAEFRIFGHSRAGHARELLVETEVVLERDGSQGLALLLDAHMLLGFDGLVQALGIAAPFHDAAGEFVHDLDLAVHHHVIHIAMEEELRLQGLLEVISQLCGRISVDVLYAQHGFDAIKAHLGGVDGLLRLIHLEVLVQLELRHHRSEALVGLRGLATQARYDERGAGFVDEDGVHLVHHGEMVTALHAVLRPHHHVVTQVVEAELRIGTVGHIGLIGGHLLNGLHAALDEAHLHPQEAVDASHPLGVALGQVIVHGDDVHVVAGDGIQVARQGGHERLAFAGLHLGDLSGVQSHATDELHVEMTQPYGTHAGLAHGGERLREQVLQRLPCLIALPQASGHA